MTDQEQSLLDLYRQLTEHDAHALVRYAEFLAGYEQTTADIVEESGLANEPDAAGSDPDIPQPEKIERPEKERVVDALKRLSATYPMLEKKNLLDKASELVAQHVMFGKPAPQVIDEIEGIFADAYDKFVAEQKRG